VHRLRIFGAKDLREVTQEITQTFARDARQLLAADLRCCRVRRFDRLDRIGRLGLPGRFCL